MEIRTKRLVLKPMSMEYLHTVHAYASDPENTRFMTRLPNEALEETERFIRGAEAAWGMDPPAFCEFVVLLGDAHIGAASVYPSERSGEAEVGWIINKAYWGRGYAAEAARAAMDYAASRLGIRRFIAHCDAENDASRRVMEKLGMRFVSREGGRKNRSSDEERMELLYDLNV